MNIESNALSNYFNCNIMVKSTFESDNVEATIKLSSILSPDLLEKLTNVHPELKSINIIIESSPNNISIPTNDVLLNLEKIDSNYADSVLEFAKEFIPYQDQIMDYLRTNEQNILDYIKDPLKVFAAISKLPEEKIKKIRDLQSNWPKHNLDEDEQ